MNVIDLEDFGSDEAMEFVREHYSLICFLIEADVRGGIDFDREWVYREIGCNLVDHFRIKKDAK